MEIQELQQQRTNLFTDLYAKKIPKRVPMRVDIKWDAAIQFCGMDIKNALSDKSKWPVFTNEICSQISSDRLPIGGNIRMPIFYTLLESTGIVMSESGAMQHPEVHLLETDEYDEFICDPFACMVDKLLPRLYKSLDTTSGRASIIMAEAYKARADALEEMSRISAINTKKYGYAMITNGGFTEAPFDFLADFMRSFTGISSDIRRKPQCVLDSCDALLPHMVKVGLNKDSSAVSRTEIPLHMAPFLNTKLFEKFYWPSFEKLIKGLSQGGAGIFLQAENDWMRYLEHLNSLEGDIEIEFEYGDPALTAKKIEGKHVIEGFYPAVMIQTASKEKCVDKAKELLDILMQGKNYIFSFDKGFFTMNTEMIKNISAVLEYVKENGCY